MNLPGHITRQQITDAFNILGLDANKVLILVYEPHREWLEVDLRGPADQPSIEHIAVKIAILEHAPEPDLVALARQEARE